jgi:F420-dependent oxidoreductase-like protein
MKLGINGVAGGAGEVHIDMDKVRFAESAGFDSCWVSEIYGSDTISVASYILSQTSKINVGTAIMQMRARSPAMCAMTAMSLTQLSGGRFIPGLGASGPQVIEGWHGELFGKPVTQLREYIQIMKTIFKREGPLEFDGVEYQIPNKGPGSTGLGKPLKSILKVQQDIPIYAATLSPRGVEAAAQVADGFFPIWMDPERYDIFEPSIDKGFAKTPGKMRTDFNVSPFVSVKVTDDVKAGIANLKGMMGFYIGGMGAKNKNFYNDYAKKMGFEEAAETIQDHFLGGRRDEAIAAVPDELVDACHLVGPKERIVERLQRWKDAEKRDEVSTMIMSGSQADLEVIAETML